MSMCVCYFYENEMKVSWNVEKYFPKQQRGNVLMKKKPF